MAIDTIIAVVGLVAILLAVVADRFNRCKCPCTCKRTKPDIRHRWAGIK